MYARCRELGCAHDVFDEIPERDLVSWRTVEDFRDWTNWLLYRGRIGVKGEESWEAWWDAELIAAAWKPLIKKVGLWKSVRSMARLYDAGMGMFIFMPIAFFSWLPFISTFQTRLMFNQAFS